MSGQTLSSVDLAAGDPLFSRDHSPLVWPHYLGAVKSKSA